MRGEKGAGERIRKAQAPHAACATVGKETADCIGGVSGFGLRPNGGQDAPRSGLGKGGQALAPGIMAATSMPSFSATRRP